jgi:BASS family bile acid:Na+ symporter
LLRLSYLTAIKLIVLPAILYGASLWIMPDYAIPVLLLSGVSTGVVAPFMATLVEADSAIVLRMVIVTSLLVPFSLPGMVKLLAGAEITIPLDTMIRMLALVIFVPLAGVAIVRRMCPGWLETLTRLQYPISLVIFGIINLGVFSKYSGFIFQNPLQLAVAVAVAYVLSVAYYFTGFVAAPDASRSEKLAMGVSMAIMNNVLIIVFASEFFGPLSPTLAAMYMFPFFTMIVPVKLIRDHTGWLEPRKKHDLS